MSLEGRDLTLGVENYYSSRGSKVYDINFADKLEYDDVLDKFIRVRGLKDASDIAIFRLLHYDLDHDIFIHSNDANAPPDFSLVALHDKEKPIDPFNHRVLDFVRYEIHKHTGLNLADYLLLPRHMQEDIITVIDNERNIRIRETEQATRDAQRDLNSTKQ